MNDNRQPYTPHGFYRTRSRPVTSQAQKMTALSQLCEAEQAKELGEWLGNFAKNLTGLGSLHSGSRAWLYRESNRRVTGEAARTTVYYQHVCAVPAEVLRAQEGYKAFADSATDKKFTFDIAPGNPDSPYGTVLKVVLSR